MDFDGIAQGIDKRVDFGGQSAARDPPIACLPFFCAPALYDEHAKLASTIVYASS